MKNTFTLLFSLLLSSVSLAGSGEYRVPVNTELEPHATFKMNNISVIQSGDFASLSYALPKEMTGIELPASSFTGRIHQDRNLELTGTFGTVACDGPKILVTSKCHVDYNETYKEYLEILDPQIERAMERNTPDLDVLMLKKQVWEKFSGDPLGFIHFDDISLDY